MGTSRLLTKDLFGISPDLFFLLESANARPSRWSCQGGYFTFSRRVLMATMTVLKDIRVVMDKYGILSGYAIPVAQY